MKADDLGIEGTYTPEHGLIWFGRKYSIYKLARDFNLDRKTLERRLSAGMSVESALSRPLRKRKKLSAREKALRAGESKFYGRKCDRHNNELRYTANYRCVMCHQEDQAARRATQKFGMEACR